MTDEVTAAPLPCPLCGHQSIDYSVEGRTCPSCHSVFASVLPTDDELARYYADFNTRYTGGGRKEAATDRQLRYARRYLEVVQEYSPASHLVDVGSSTNPFPGLAAAAGYKVTTIDYVPPAKLAPGVRFVAGTLDDAKSAIQSSGGNFDVVTAFAVIEHCRWPTRAAATLAGLCAPGGVIILTTPEIGRLSDRYAMGRCGWFYPPEHLNIISRRGLEAIFAAQQCRLLFAGRFELNLWRWLARYGLVVAEGMVGAAFKTVLPDYWHKVRRERAAKGLPIALYVFRKSSLPAADPPVGAG